MNIYEAYEELKKGKFVRVKGCKGTVIFMLRMPFLDLTRCPIIMSAGIYSSTSDYFHRPTELKLSYPQIHTKIDDIELLDREFESFTEEEMLAIVQKEFDGRPPSNTSNIIKGTTVDVAV